MIGDDLGFANEYRGWVNYEPQENGTILAKLYDDAEFRCSENRPYLRSGTASVPLDRLRFRFGRLLIAGARILMHRRSRE